MELDGTGMLNERKEKKKFKYSPTFTLPPRALGRTHVGIQTHKIVLPAIQTIITTDEKEFFKNVYGKIKYLETLKGIAEQ